MAQRAISPLDKEAWLQLATDWLTLAAVRDRGDADNSEDQERDLAALVQAMPSFKAKDRPIYLKWLDKGFDTKHPRSMRFHNSYRSAQRLATLSDLLSITREAGKARTSESS